MVDRQELNRRGVLLGMAGAGMMVGMTSASPALAQAGERAMAPSRPVRLEARTTDGLTLRGEARGLVGAPEILFVHGLRQSKASWSKQLADPLLSGFRTVAFDLRGHGDSDKPDRPAAYSEPHLWADDVAAMIEVAGLRRPVIVGWSLGGYVAGAYLQRHSGSRVAGVNLVDAVTNLSGGFLTEEAGRFAARCNSHDLAERAAATAEFLTACFHRQPTEAEFRDMLVVNGMAARAVNEGFGKTRVTNLEPVFSGYRGPVLVTHGTHDRLVQVAMSERIAALSPLSRLSLFRNSGHSPFLEEPDRYNRELAAFVRRAVGG